MSGGKEWVPGASEGRSMRTCAGNCTGIDPRTLGESAASMFFSVTPSLAPRYVPSLPPFTLSLILRLCHFFLPFFSPCSFTRILSRFFIKCLFRSTSTSFTNIIDNLNCFLEKFLKKGDELIRYNGIYILLLYYKNIKYIQSI